MALALAASAARALAAAPAAPDWWQIRLANGDYLYELQLLELRGDTLVLTHADTLVRVAVADIDELRWVRPSEMRLGGGGGQSTVGTLSGADDEVYRLTLVPPEERRRTIEQLVREHGVKTGVKPGAKRPAGSS
jgi:hypothetical protein